MGEEPKPDKPEKPVAPEDNGRRERVLRALGMGAAVVAIVAIVLVIEHRIHGDVHGDARDEEAHGEERDEHGVEAVELSDEQVKEAELEVLTAAPGNVVVTVDLPGEVALNAEASAHVGPRVSGTVREIKKKLGDDVEKGDVLAVLDSSDLAESQGEVQSARERLTLAESTYERKKKLFDEKITSEKEYLEAKQSLAEARVTLKSAERALLAKTGGGANAAGYALTAPLAGTIVEWHLGLGEVLQPDARAYTIADLSSVWIDVTVYAKDLDRVRVGQRVFIRAQGVDKPIEGELSYLSRTVGAVTRSAQARVVLHNPGEAWRPGLFVTAEVEVDEVKAPVVVVEDALQRLENTRVVFVREPSDHGWRFEARKVTVGPHGHRRDGRLVYAVTSGIAKGESYVGKQSFLLKAELGKRAAGHEH